MVCEQLNDDNEQKKCKFMEITRACSPLYHQCTLGGAPLQKVVAHRLRSTCKSPGVKAGHKEDEGRLDKTNRLRVLAFEKRQIAI
jgi:hypothetical protein